MPDIEHNYNVSVIHVGRIKVTVSAHLVAVLVADKLGLPIPERDVDCEVCEVDPAGEDVLENQVWIAFNYKQAPTEGPVSITIPGPKPPPSPEPGE